MAKAKRRTRTRGGQKLRRFLRRAEAAQRAGGVKQIEVGFFSTAKYPDGTPVPLVAAVNEFGSPKMNIPERPFFRGALVGLDKALKPILEAGVDPQKMVVDQQTAGLLGEATKGRIQQSITDLSSPPNSPRTIARKGSSNPLIDTGKLRLLVTWKVTE